MFFCYFTELFPNKKWMYIYINIFILKSHKSHKILKNMHINAWNRREKKNWWFTVNLTDGSHSTHREKSSRTNKSIYGKKRYDYNNVQTRCSILEMNKKKAREKGICENENMDYIQQIISDWFGQSSIFFSFQTKQHRIPWFTNTHYLTQTNTIKTKSDNINCLC